MTAQELSDQLGAPTTQLYRWKANQLEELEANNPASVPIPRMMAAEIAEFRKDLAKFKRMNEILKKTVGFFSQD